MRPLTAGDLDWLVAAEQRLFDDPWSPVALADFVAGPHLALGVDGDGALCGYLLCSLGGGEADLLRIAVTPEQRRGGRGRTLLLALRRRLIEATVTDLFLEVRVSNSAAIDCYHALGFEACGRRRDYYSTPEGREDALLMRWPLAGHS